jgi:hypothetical protein
MTTFHIVYPAAPTSLYQALPPSPYNIDCDTQLGHETVPALNDWYQEASGIHLDLSTT